MIKKYKVQSKSDRKIYHQVTIDEMGLATCQCKYFEMKGFKRGTGWCEHIERAGIYEKHKRAKKSSDCQGVKK